MSGRTPAIFQGICDSLIIPYPDEPRNPEQWEEVEVGRPCFDKMIKSFGGFTTSRPDHYLFAYARELYRRGFKHEEILKACYRFSENSPNLGIRRSSVQSAIKNYAKRDLYHCCSHPILKENCISTEKCNWLKRVTHRKPSDEREDQCLEEIYGFMLSPSERLVYAHLVSLEKILRIAPGGCIFRSYRTLATELNLTDKGIPLRACQKLEARGLIKIYYEGKSNKDRRSGLCSGFQRIVPIPTPRERKKGDQNANNQI